MSRPSGPATRGPRPTLVVGLAVTALVVLARAPDGPGPLLVALGVVVLVTGVWTVLVGRSWVGRLGRGGGVAVTVVGVLLVGLGGLLSDTVGEPGPPDSQAQTTTDDASTDESTGTATQASPGTALATVDLLEVKGRAPKTGYDRDLFGYREVDLDGNGCDTRNDILARDLTAITHRPGTGGCTVETGTLADPYSGTSIDFQRGTGTSNAVQIDHVVALSDAWQKGAQQWSSATLQQFGNDPLNLLAVSGPLNAQKGDGDAATWLPPNKAYRCPYVARQVAVKHHYGLWVTSAERDAMIRVLTTCPDEPLPVRTE